MANIRRTWHYAAKLVTNKEPTPLLQQILIGTLSAGIGHEFYAYLHYCAKLPSLAELLKQPDSLNIPEEPAMLYAISHMISAYLTEDTVPTLMQYIVRMPLDFSIVTLRAALKRNDALLKVPEIRDWAHKFAQECF